MKTTMRNAAKAIIVRDGHLLVTVNRDVNGGEFYILPGGGQDFGETLHEALHRECIEEIGARIEIRDLVCIREYIGRNHEFAEFDGHVHQVEFMFHCTLDDRQQPGNGILPDSKQLGVKWIPLAELPTAPFYPAALRAVISEIAPHGALYLGDVN
jgi:8-oxo-dGTP diphosphatase